ncbi:LLM class flavin-dependent oxidoreductase, partial [Corynebacterium diphtheriae]
FMTNLYLDLAENPDAPFEPIRLGARVGTTGLTEHILLGTAGIVLPLRHPVALAKEAATVDVLSGGRLLLGLASGDRPGEYPFFGVDFDRRGETYRDGVRVLREIWSQAALGRIDQDSFLPAPADGRFH